MQESINLFEIILKYEWFQNTATLTNGFKIQFLNKKDLFEDKIKKQPLNSCFSDFTKPDNFENGVKFIKNKFELLNEHSDVRTVFCHLTFATSTENIKVTENYLNNLKTILEHPWFWLFWYCA